MANEIRMPQLSDTMDSGKILTWYKSEGEKVERGDILAEVETDKANLEIECFHSGTLLKIVIPEESEAPVGEVIAYIGEQGEELAEAPTTSPAPKKPAPVEDNSPAAEPTQVATQPTPQRAPQPTPQHGVNGVRAPQPSSEGRVKASPLARSLAEQRNIDLQQVSGTGPDGRIVKRDIESFVAGPTTPSTATAPTTQQSPPTTPPQQAKAPSTPALGAPKPGSLSDLSKMRSTIAKRMQQSVQEAPHFYTTVSVEMDEAFKLKDALREEPGFEKVNINHFIIKASAYALAREPRVNASMQGEQIYQPGEINIGMITALPDGLLIPVLHNADVLSLRDIAFEARAAIDRARAGRPSSKDLTGGTFSISNMGMFDVENFTAIINPGQGAVLAVSATVDTPVVRDGRIVIKKIMKTTLSVDHRIIDGIMSGNFLKHYKAALETPALLLL